ncbi:MAG: hypothetical protein H7A23_04070 [Leptospiraceae bacterium]|nr:hypothetical protein [Leptospiraceae bacterium]MCP5493708.1 hypothetical protein [Leptospiraceae bacterium]
MIFVVLANLLLILFDYTYLVVRPYYYLHKNLKWITEKYDPILGIEDHYDTRDFVVFFEEYQFLLQNEETDKKEKIFQKIYQEISENIENVFNLQDYQAQENYLYQYSEYQNLKGGPNTEYSTQTRVDFYKQISWYAIKYYKKLLIGQYDKLVKENPFEKAGLTGNLEEMKDLFREKFQKDTKSNLRLRELSSRKSFRWFIDMTDENKKSRMEFFESSIKPLVVVNYYRKNNRNGELKSSFYLLDMPFLILFVVEFLARWYYSQKRKEYIAWFLFPLYNWYDIVGLLPFARGFRLFRLVSIYIRLQESELTTIGDDIITRTVKHFSNIIKEEITDMVTIRILTEVQQEIKSGDSINMIMDAIESRREEIKEMVIEMTKSSLRNQNENNIINQRMRLLLEETLARSASQAKTLQMFPRFLKETITVDIGVSIYDSFQEVIAMSLKQRSGDNTVEALIDYTMDEMIKGAKVSEVNRLTTEIILEIIENMKKAVAVKKWAKQE